MKEWAFLIITYLFIVFLYFNFFNFEKYLNSMKFGNFRKSENLLIYLLIKIFFNN